MRFRKKSEKVPAKKVIVTGVAGAGISVGCTHFAIMLANYLAGYLRKKTAVLEFNDSGDFARLERVCTGSVSEEKAFKILEADYFKAADDGDLLSAVNAGYEEIVIDFGDYLSSDQTDFARCDRQFLIGSFSEWQQERFRESGMFKTSADNKSRKYLAVFGSEETGKEFLRRYRIDAHRIPFSADAFAVTRECAEFFGELLSER